jgi:hypothetical protein
MNPVHFTIVEKACCVCKKHLGSVDGKGVAGVSHGYCPEDLTKAWKELNSRLRGNDKVIIKEESENETRFCLHAER